MPRLSRFQEHARTRVQQTAASALPPARLAAAIAASLQTSVLCATATASSASARGSSSSTASSPPAKKTNSPAPNGFARSTSPPNPSTTSNSRTSSPRSSPSRTRMRLPHGNQSRCHRAAPASPNLSIFTDENPLSRLRERGQEVRAAPVSDPRATTSTSRPGARDPARHPPQYPPGPTGFDDSDRAKPAHASSRSSTRWTAGYSGQVCRRAVAPPADAVASAAPAASPPAPLSPPPVRALPSVPETSSCPRTYHAALWAATLDAPTPLW
jgi:hypothetical protein